MSNYVIRDNNGFIDAQTGEFFEYRGGNDKNFAVIARCGHCLDKHYFIPVVKSTRAKDAESAAYFIRQTARVQRDKNNCIIDVCEVSILEDMLIHTINEKDPFFIAHSQREVDVDDTMRRRIIDEKYARFHGHVKTAEEYDEDCVVERFCAPRWQGEKLIYPQNINMREMLDEFFKQKVRIYGCDGGFLTLMCLYYEIYGVNNALGIKYNSQHGILGYINSNGDKFAKKLPLELQKHMDEYERKRKEAEERAAEQKRREEELLRREVSTRRISPIDRFKARMEKGNKLRQGNSSDESESGC